MQRGRKISYDPTILIQRIDHTKLEARGKNISYDPIIRLHFAEFKRKTVIQRREKYGEK